MDTDVSAKPVEVGDLFSASWGYDQTNVDYYKVTRTTEKTAWLVRIGARSIKGSEGFMSDSVVPNPDVVLCDRCNGPADSNLHDLSADRYVPVDDRHHEYVVTPTRHRIQWSSWRATPDASLKVRDWGVWAHRIEGAGRQYRSWYA